MVRKPIFVLDTNVFVHAANCKGENTEPRQANDTKLIIHTLITLCFPFLFSKDTLQELVQKFNDLKKKEEYMQYNVVKDIYQNVLYVKDEKNEKKAHYGDVNQRTDEVEEIIADKDDRKFLYLLRDYGYLGKKILITSDKRAFFPRDPEIKNKLQRYIERYNITIYTPRQFTKKIKLGMLFSLNKTIKKVENGSINSRESERINLN